MRRALLISFSLACLHHGSIAQFADEPRYGQGCGIAGVDPDQRYAIETLIHYKDTAGIFGWLHDKEPVLQAYALEALIRLQLDGLSVPESESHRMDTLRRSKRLVHVCSGCSHWEMPLAEAVKMFVGKQE